jgi:two-component system, NtrC family, nitrogen regulation sensor histidine kinase NtrY
VDEQNYISNPLDLFMRGIFHEIKHGLFGISMEIQRFKNTPNYENEQAIKSIAKIEKTMAFLSFAMDTWENDFVEEVNYTNVHNIIETIFSTIKRDDNIKLEIKFSNIQTIAIYKREFFLVAYNLIINSIESIRKKQSNKYPEGCIGIKILCKNNIIVISIEDNGNGIRRENIDNVFNLSFSTKNSGTGIGLYFVKKIVEEEWKGTITVESTHGKGAIFTIKIPVNRNFK